MLAGALAGAVGSFPSNFVQSQDDTPHDIVPALAASRHVAAAHALALHSWPPAGEVAHPGDLKLTKGVRHPIAPVLFSLVLGSCVKPCGAR